MLYFHIFILVLISIQHSLLRGTEWNEFKYNSTSEKAFWNSIPEWKFDENLPLKKRNSSGIPITNNLDEGYSGFIKSKNENLRNIYQFSDGWVTRHKSWNINGQAFSETPFQKGKIHGKVRKWYPNGQKRSEGEYINGVDDGIEKIWFIDGKKLAVVSWKDGKIVTADTWKPNGEMCLETKIDELGKGRIVLYNSNNDYKSYRVIDGKIIDDTRESKVSKTESLTKEELEKQLMQEMDQMLASNPSRPLRPNSKPQLPYESDLKNRKTETKSKFVIKGANQFNLDSLSTFIQNNTLFNSWIESIEEKQSHEVQTQFLLEFASSLKKSLKQQGFLAPTISIDKGADPKNNLHVIQIEEGKRYNFLGYKCPDNLPEWLTDITETFLGLRENSLENINKLTFSKLKSNNLNFQKALWSGEFDLGNSLNNNPENAFVGFSENVTTGVLANLVSKIKTLSSASKVHYPILWDTEAEINSLIACLASRQGYPATRFEFTEEIVEDGYYLTAKLSNYDNPLTLAKISIEGLKFNEPAFVETLIMENNGLNVGAVLTSTKLQIIKNSLLESGCFFDVGIFPDRLAGPANLKIVLNDHPRLPKLTEEWSRSLKAVRDLARFLYRETKFMRLNLQVPGHSKLIHTIQFSVDWESGESRILLVDKNNRFIGSMLIKGKDISLFYEDLAFQTRLLSSVQISAGGGIREDANDKIRHIFLSVGMSTLDKESNFHFFIEPAFWFVDYQDTKFSTNPKVGYEEITTEDGKSFKIYRNQDDQISQISINENENNVSVDFFRNQPGSSTETHKSGLKNATFGNIVSKILEENDLNEALSSNLEQRFLMEFLLPTFARWTSETLIENPQKKSLNKSETITSFQKDENGKFILEHTGLDNEGIEFEYIRKNLGWQKDMWPSILVSAVGDYFSGNQNKLRNKLTGAMEMNATEMGPLGNTLWGLFCKSFVSKQLANQFFTRAKKTNLYFNFIDDINKLGLEEELREFFHIIVNDQQIWASSNELTKLYERLFPELKNQEINLLDKELVDANLPRFHLHYIRAKLNEFVDTQMIEEPLKNGRYITNYPGGQIRMIENYTAGMKNGPELKYYPNGELEQNATFFEDKLHGRATGFYPNGQIKFSEKFKYGNLHGSKTTYLENGIKQSEEFYNEGKLDGVIKGWYLDGSIEYQNRWINGKIIECSRWKPSGQLCPDTNVSEGKGVNNGYFLNGEKAWMETLENGLRNGKSVMYFENGKIQQVSNYLNDKLEGESRVFFPNGNIATIEFFKEGKKDGKDLDFDESGKKISEIYYREGIPTGKSIFNYEGE